ncbi:acetyltransferase [Flavobacterium davisii]|uniref:Acetyltransferase n=1 Tax=Flavobacterium columnare TaxID=996 RepID=A0A8G0KTW8_9FLAO|nr:acetyltransferase [Flavobacterium davisii]QYS90112.1 acetyltransferase [Flavobacterium davisii]
MILYGASGHCKVIIDILFENKIQIKTIVDDVEKLKTIFDFPIINSRKFKFHPSDNCIIAIGNNLTRKKIADTLNVNFVIAIHPKAIISKFSSVGEGTVIMAGVVLNAHVKAGKHCIINTSASVDHDCWIENYVHISPNASLAGNVFVGEGSHIGIGATIIQGIKIGKWSTIGAGAVIIEDVPDYAVVVGNPRKSNKI